MLIVMKSDATPEQIAKVCETIVQLGFQAHPMPGPTRTAICITGNDNSLSRQIFSNMPGVSEVIVVTKPYKLVSRETRHESTTFALGKTIIGKDFTLIAGPCSVEAKDITFRIAEKLQHMGVKFFRGGAFKPRTSPYAFQGLAEQGLTILAAVKQRFDMQIVTEVVDTETLPMVAEIADIIQVGTRNMSNTSLLKALGKINKPVLLKRGLAATIEELLLAAEYIMSAGNYRVIFCERGIRTFNNYTRNTLDVAAIPYLRAHSHLPVFADPSHAAGITSLVTPLALAATAAGAQGLIIEVHDDAARAYSDGQQALHPDQLARIISKIKQLSELCELNEA